MLFAVFTGLAATTLASGQDVDDTAPTGSLDEVGGRMTKGTVPVLDFLRFIQRVTGLLVLYPSSSPDVVWTEARIEVLDNVPRVTYAVVRSILEVNGYDIRHQILEDGQEVIFVSNARDRNAAQGGAAAPTEVIDPKTELPQGRSDELATMVLLLTHADTQVVVAALRDLIGTGGGPRGATGDVTIVQVTSSNSLIVKAKYEILRHIKDLVRFIDVPVTGPKPILEIVSVYEADAEELVNTISEVMNIQAGVIGNRRTARPGTPAQQPGGAVPPRTPTGQGEYTRLIADLRTQKILIDTTEEEQLSLISWLINELDQKIDNPRPNTHLYKVRYLRASDLAEDLRQLVEGVAGRGGTLGRGTRTTGRTAPAAQPQGQQQALATRIVPHNDTNSLMIQADYEEYLEIVRVLEGIDRKRNQVFLETALVQVNEGSSLNYTIEYLAGDLDDESTRVAALTAFLTGPVITDSPLSIGRDLTNAAGATGLLTAVSRDGQLPILLRAIKTDSDARILATPFILADDNETSSITSNTTIFFETTTSTNTGTSTSQGETEAGIQLSLTPTISENVVLMELSLSVSSFGGDSSGSGSVPDRSESTIDSLVTVEDGQLFIIGGLVRESDSIAISKVPILGDLPLIGRLFQSRNSTKTRNNLYIFLTAHILRSANFEELEDLSKQALESVKSFGDDFHTEFQSPKRNRLGSSQDKKDGQK
ncbi:MAG: secretin N-terminal domain-containing protein [Planctomycetota bacterium]